MAVAISEIVVEDWVWGGMAPLPPPPLCATLSCGLGHQIRCPAVAGSAADCHAVMIACRREDVTGQGIRYQLELNHPLK